MRQGWKLRARVGGLGPKEELSLDLSLPLEAIDWAGDRTCGGHCGGSDSCLLEKHHLCVSPAPDTILSYKPHACTCQPDMGRGFGYEGVKPCAEWAGEGCQGAAASPVQPSELTHLREVGTEARTPPYTHVYLHS